MHFEDNRQCSCNGFAKRGLNNSDLVFGAENKGLEGPGEGIAWRDMKGSETTKNSGDQKVEVEDGFRSAREKRF